MTDVETLSKRLARLEARFRWMKRMTILACLMIAAGAIMGQTSRPVTIPQGLDQVDPLISAPQLRRDGQPVQQVRTPVETEIRAQHFVLVDEKNKERASLVSDSAGSVFLVMFDSTGKTRASLSVGNEGPSLIFYDRSGQQRTIIGSTTSVGSHVNENGIAEKAPASSIILFDRTGKLLWREP
jgi:hypothetical protein